MTVVVPVSDLEAFKLQTTINNLNTLIAANPQNVSLAAQLYTAQLNLVLNLVSEGTVNPASILTNETYIGNTATNQPI